MLHYVESFPEITEEDLKPLKQKYQRQLGEKPNIHPTARVYKSELGDYSDIGASCSIRESSVGDYSYAAGHVAITWTTVGNFCSIASYTRINPGNHPYWRVTQNHCTYRRKMYGFGEDDEEFFDWRKSQHCRIGHDVWIGHGCTVMAGAKIGTGAVIGAGAVVSKAQEIGPYEIAVGVPARPVKKRFPDHVIQQLLEIEYWYWDRKTLEERFEDLLDIEAFLEKYSR
jgi:hypothetical protein